MWVCVSCIFVLCVCVCEHAGSWCGFHILFDVHDISDTTSTCACLLLSLCGEEGRGTEEKQEEREEGRGRTRDAEVFSALESHSVCVCFSQSGCSWPTGSLVTQQGATEVRTECLVKF